MNLNFKSIIGVYTKLVEMLDSGVNYLDEVKKIIDDVLYNPPDVSIIISQAVTSLDGLLENDLSKLDQNANYIKLRDIANAIHNEIETISVYKQDLTDNVNSEIVVEQLPLLDAISFITDQRNTIESCLTTCDAMINAVEDEALELSTSTSNVLMKIPTTIAGLREKVSDLISSAGGYITDANLPTLFYTVLDFFGLRKSDDVSEEVETITGYKPGVMWMNAFLSNYLQAQISLANVYLNFGATFYTFTKNVFSAIIKGVAAAGSWLIIKSWNWCSNLLNTVNGTGAGIQRTGFNGDGTVLGLGYTCKLTMSDTIYGPSNQYVEYFMSNWSDLLTKSRFTSFYTLGAKREYQLLDGDILITVSPMLVNAGKVIKMLQKHNCWPLPAGFTRNAVNRAIEFGYATNYSTPTTQEILDLFNELQDEDLSYVDFGWNNNATFAEAIFYGKFLDILTCVVSQYDAQMILDPNNPFDLAGWRANDLVDVTRLIPDQSSGWTNLSLAKRCCYMSRHGISQFGDFDVDTGAQQIIVDSWRGAYQEDFSPQLCLLMLSYMDRSSLGNDSWLTYLRRQSRLKPTFKVSSDEEVDTAAKTSLLTAATVVVAVATAAVAIKYLPKFLKYRKQIAMQYDTACFNYGDDPTDANWSKVRSLKWKNTLVGQVYTLPNEVSSLTLSPNSDAIAEIRKLIIGNRQQQ